MTPLELKRYWAMQGPIKEAPDGEYVRFADVEAYTQAAIAAATMGAVKPLAWESIKTAPRNGEWFFAKTARGTIRFVHFGDIYDRFPISHDHTEIWETEPVEWISTSRVLSALSIHTDAMAALEAVRAQADHAGYDRCKERAAQLIEALFIGGGVAKIAAQIRALEGSITHGLFGQNGSSQTNGKAVRDGQCHQRSGKV